MTERLRELERAHADAPDDDLVLEEKLPDDQKRSVPEIDRQHRLKVAEELCGLTFTLPEDAPHLVRKHTYEELVRQRDYWRDRDDEEKGEVAAKDVLARRVNVR